MHHASRHRHRREFRVRVRSDHAQLAVSTARALVVVMRADREGRVDHGVASLHRLTSNRVVAADVSKRDAVADADKFASHKRPHVLRAGIESTVLVLADHAWCRGRLPPRQDYEPLRVRHCSFEQPRRMVELDVGVCQHADATGELLRTHAEHMPVPQPFVSYAHRQNLLEDAEVAVRFERAVEFGNPFGVCRLVVFDHKDHSSGSVSTKSRTGTPPRLSAVIGT